MRMMSSAIAICCEVSITTCSGISFIAPSISRNAMTSPLMTRPVHSAPREMDFSGRSTPLWEMTVMVCARVCSFVVFRSPPPQGDHKGGGSLSSLHRREICLELLEGAAPALVHAVEAGFEGGALLV